MTNNFKFAKRIRFTLSDKVYENVYWDRFNSIFKGYYVVVPEDTMKYEVVRSTERFGSQDVVLVDEVKKPDLTEERLVHIAKLNAQDFKGL
jgi:hypothetical protein